MKRKSSFSSFKRIFFAPVNEEKFIELRERNQREIMQIDPFNIR